MMPDTSTRPSPGNSFLPTAPFLILIVGTEIMSLLTLTGILDIPGVRWDIMPALAASLTMLSCILTIATRAHRPNPQQGKYRLVSFIIIGILSFLIANMGLRPWAPSVLYSLASMTAGMIAFAIGYKSIFRRP